MQSAYLMPATRGERTDANCSFFHTLPIIDYAINNRLTPFISMQNHYNLIYREEEREMMPTIKVGKNFSLSPHDAPRQPPASPFSNNSPSLFASTLALDASRGLRSHAAP